MKPQQYAEMHEEHTYVHLGAPKSTPKPIIDNPQSYYQGFILFTSSGANLHLCSEPNVFTH